MKAGSILLAIAMLMSPTIRAAPLFYLTVKKEDAKSVIDFVCLFRGKNVSAEISVAVKDNQVRSQGFVLYIPLR